MFAKKDSCGRGKVDNHGAEIWDTDPVFRGDRQTLLDHFKLLFYPKKFFLYRFIARARNRAGADEPFRILDVGCGTGATVIDFKKMFGRSVEVIGIDVVRMQAELAQQKMRRYGVWATIEWYDGETIPYPADYFDAVYTSDVLGHVANVPLWLEQISRVLKPGGVLAMFSESALGRHAYIRRYLFEHGLNVDPHAQFHISLYSKTKLKALLHKAGFDITRMYSVFWASFWVHPDEFYPALANAQGFRVLRLVNAVLFLIKKATRPVSTALAEVYGLVEAIFVGRWVEAQGYIVLARKK